VSTNRTKIDWAYRQAERIVDTVCDDTSQDYDHSEAVRKVAAILRRVEKRGRAYQQRIEKEKNYIEYTQHD
jgi:hypothetical protein